MAHFEHTTEEERYSLSGVLVGYLITADEGYVLHDKARDWLEENPETGEEYWVLGYTHTVGLAVGYNFTTNPKQIYAVLESTVPQDQIFNAGTGEVTI